MTLKIGLQPTFAYVTDLQGVAIANSLPLNKPSLFSYCGKDYIFVPSTMSISGMPEVYECQPVLTYII